MRSRGQESGNRESVPSTLTKCSFPTLAASEAGWVREAEEKEEEEKGVEDEERGRDGGRMEEMPPSSSS